MTTKHDLDEKRNLIIHGAVSTDAAVLEQFEESWQEAARHWLEETV